MSINNGAAWNTVGGQTFTPSSSSYTQLSISFVCLSNLCFNIRLGSNMNTTYGQVAQTAGTSFVHGWQIFVKGKQSLLESNLVINGTVKSNDVIFGTSAYSLNSSYGYINLRLTTSSRAIGNTNLVFGHL